MLHLALNFWTHQRILQHKLDPLKILDNLQNVQLIADFLLGFFIEFLQFFLLPPAAVTAAALQDVRNEQLNVVGYREPNYPMLAYLLL